MSDVKIKTLADYKKDIGPGVWFSIHTLAALADKTGDYKSYEDFFRRICGSMGCECETHCSEMLTKYPIRNYTKMFREGERCGGLYHSYICHNEVDARLGKPQYTFEEVYPLYVIREGHIGTCSAPGNLDDLVSKFPNLISKTDHIDKKDSIRVKKFRLINVT